MIGYAPALVLIGAVATASGAAADPICADSPGKASQACTVPAGHIQVESNLVDWTRKVDDGQRENDWLWGDTNLKYGLDDWSDIGVEVIPLNRVSSRGGGQHYSAWSFGDVAVAYKRRLTAKDALLQLAIFPFVKIPTAQRPVGNGEWEGGLIVPLVYSIRGTKLSFNLAPELDRTADSDRHGHHWTMVQAASLGLALTDRFSVSAEIWGQWDWDPDGTTREYTFDASAAFLLRQDLQIQAGANIGLNSAADDIEINAGFAKRF